MKVVTLGLFVVLCVSLYATDAAVAVSRPSTHIDHPGKCWDDTREVAYKPGSHYPTGECLEIYCADNFSMQYLTCGAVRAGDGFHIEIDENAQYPACCPNIVPDEA